MSINPNNFKQIQDVLASQQGTSDSQVTGAAHNMQNNLLHKKGKGGKHAAKKVSSTDKMAAIRARMKKKG